MSEAGDFLAATMPRLTAAQTALHNGDAGPRMARWARNDPVTLIAAAVAKSGQADVGPTFERPGASFPDCTAYQYEVLSVATVFRREDGEWKIVHRHAGPLASKPAAEAVERLSAA